MPGLRLPLAEALPRPHPTSQVAWGRGVTTQAARRLLTRPIDPAALVAARKRLRLEERVRSWPLLVREAEGPEWPVGGG